MQPLAQRPGVGHAGGLARIQGDNPHAPIDGRLDVLGVKDGLGFPRVAASHQQGVGHPPIIIGGGELLKARVGETRHTGDIGGCIVP